MTEEAIIIFREEIRELLLLMPKICNETDLKKKYREETGQSISQKLVELGERKIYDFLRFKCKDICDVYRFDNEIKIQRSADVEHHGDAENQKAKKRHKANTAPKLNVPKVGILQSSTFRRLNPQGFNKKKVKSNEKDLINTYKQPNQVRLDDEKENASEHEYAPTVGLSLADFVPLDSSIVQEISPWLDAGTASAAAVLKFTPLQSSQSYAMGDFQKSLPNVQNPCDFPSLPHKSEKMGELFDDPNESAFRDRSANKDEGTACTTKRWNEVAKKSIYETPPPKRSSSVPPKMNKRPQTFATSTAIKSKPPVSFNQGAIRKSAPPPPPSPSNNVINAIVSVDDLIFITNYPDVIMDPNRRLSRPRLRPVETRITLPVFITRYVNPTNFIYHYCEISLCRLMREMQSFYKVEAKRALMISKVNIRAGLLCAVFNNSWNRGVICESPDNNGRVKVIMCDFGAPMLVHMKDIRYLLDKFAREPIKCVRGALAGIRPFNNVKWTREAEKKFISLACGTSTQGTLVAYNAEQDTYILEMCENLNSSLTISEQLIAAKMAQPVFIGQTYPYAILL